jgi:membrane-associated phospholipid phosphatase
MVKKRLVSLGKNPLVLEAAPLLGLYWLYSSIRWLIARDSPYEAFNNAFKLVHLERQLGIFHEPTIQSWLIEHARTVVHAANEFYTIGYIPVLILCGVLLYRFAPDRYQIFRLTFLLGLGFALICFSVFPLAPPRMLPGFGFVDTQQVFGSSLYNRKAVLSFYNPYAAMPSLHFGWTLLVGIMAYSFQRRIFRIIGVLYPATMAVVIVTTGHHYFLDIVGGGIVVGLAYALVKTFPFVVRELSSSPAGINFTFTHRKTPSHPEAYTGSANPPVSPWSRQRCEAIQRRKLRSTMMAMLTNWRPPL